MKYRAYYIDGEEEYYATSDEEALELAVRGDFLPNQVLNLDTADELINDEP